LEGKNSMIEECRGAASTLDHQESKDLCPVLEKKAVRGSIRFKRTKGEQGGPEFFDSDRTALPGCRQNSERGSRRKGERFSTMNEDDLSRSSLGEKRLAIKGYEGRPPGLGNTPFLQKGWPITSPKKAQGTCWMERGSKSKTVAESSEGRVKNLTRGKGKDTTQTESRGILRKGKYAGPPKRAQGREGTPIR